MIEGIGIDIIEIDRIKNAVEKNNKFLNKILNENEIVCLKKRNMRIEYIAGRFAAKEAVSKALGTGFSKFGFKDISIENLNSGIPIVKLSGKAEIYAQKYGKYKIHLSISHSDKYAAAQSILEVNNDESSNV